jgi:hypothetical protein
LPKSFDEHASPIRSCRQCTPPDKRVVVFSCIELAGPPPKVSDGLWPIRQHQHQLARAALQLDARLPSMIPGTYIRIRVASDSLYQQRGGSPEALITGDSWERGLYGGGRAFFNGRAERFACATRAPRHIHST